MEMQQEALRSALLAASSKNIQEQQQLQQYSRNNSQGILRNESGLSFHIEGEDIQQTIEMQDMSRSNENTNQIYGQKPSQKYSNNITATNTANRFGLTQAIYAFLSSLFLTFGAYLTSVISQGEVSVLELMFYRSLGIILCLFILYKLSQYISHVDESKASSYRHSGSGFKDIAYIQPRERKYVQIISTVSALVVFSQFYAFEKIPLAQAYTLINITPIFTFLVVYLCSTESLTNSIASPRKTEQSQITPNTNQINANNNNDNTINNITSIYGTIIQDKPVTTTSLKPISNIGQLAGLALMALGAGIIVYLTYVQQFTATVLSILGGSVIVGAVQAMASQKSWNTPLPTILFYGSFVQLLLSPLLIAVIGSFHALSVKEFTQIFLMAVSQIAGTKCQQLASTTAAGYEPAISLVFCIFIDYFTQAGGKMILSLCGTVLVAVTNAYLAYNRTPVS